MRVRETRMEKLCGDMIRMTLLPGFTPAKAVNFVERIRNSGDLFTPASGGAEKMVEEILFSAEKSALSLATKRYEKEIEYIAKNGIKTVSIFDEAYPASLREIYDPPLVLYFKGDLAVEDVDAVGVVGARHASEYGLRMAEEISAGLCNAGVTVVSGMAKGIDTAAHRGAIKSFGRTIAVMGSGFANLYPDDAQEMVLRIAENGAVLTENSSDILP
ncbi:MAG TPA: DNA-processing protein DprA, partial [Candidatus Omnitrophota bacterium]|nr:DNA-processing protein DprA [Candidatus Omnitrophota bacterium]